MSLVAENFYSKGGLTGWSAGVFRQSVAIFASHDRRWVTFSGKKSCGMPRAIVHPASPRMRSQGIFLIKLPIAKPQDLATEAITELEAVVDDLREIFALMEKQEGLEH